MFQELHKNPKHLQLSKIYKSVSYDCCMVRQQYKILLKCCCRFSQQFILASIFAFRVIYPQSVFSLHFLVPVLACVSHFIYFLVACTFAFSSQLLTVLFPAFSIQEYSTLFSMIRFLVPFHLHILYLAFLKSYFKFLFQSF